MQLFIDRYYFFFSFVCFVKRKCVSRVSCVRVFCTHHVSRPLSNLYPLSLSHPSMTHSALFNYIKNKLNYIITYKTLNSSLNTNTHTKTWIQCFDFILFSRPCKMWNSENPHLVADSRSKCVILSTELSLDL